MRGAAFVFLLGVLAAASPARESNELRPLKQVLEYLAGLGSTNIVARSAEIEKLQVDVREMKIMEPRQWHDALTQLAARNGLRLDESERERNIIYVWQPQRVSISFRDADIREVIWSIVNQAKINLVIDPAVQGTISIKLTDVPWDTALESVVKTGGYVIVRENGSIARVQGKF